MNSLKTVTCLLLLLCKFVCFAQQNEAENKQDETSNFLRIYLDCNYCDNAFFRQNVKNVSIVRDRKLADVHLLFISQESGNGGTSERIQFIGLGEYKHLSDIIPYAIEPNLTTAEKRDIRLKYIELGLIRFRIEAGQAETISLTIEKSELDTVSIPKDPWNGWVFSANISGWFNGQETANSRSVSSGLAAKRIAQKNKFITRAGFSQNRAIFNYDGVKTVSKKRSMWANAKEIISLTDHWSYGMFGDLGNSLFSNYKVYLVGKTGLEYDFFEYADSYNKQAIVAYQVGMRYNNYYDTTVFNKTTDALPFHEFKIGGIVKQGWGNVSSTVTYQNYLHDFSLNSVSLWLNLNVRLFKGFSWRINGSFDLTRNQINIAKQGASIEDVLLQQQQLGSGYSYWMNTGINYSFGSPNNSVVNPRFDI